MAVVAELAQQLGRSRHRLHFADQLPIGLALRRPDLLALLALAFLADQRRDDLVPAHADVAVDWP